MKTMSIIGIVWFSLSFLFMMAFLNTNMPASAGWGLLGMLYAIPFSIVGLVKSVQSKKPDNSITQELLNLFELKEKGVITEDEFQAMKMDLLGR